MQNSYCRPPGSGSQSQYELPPVLSVTSPAHLQQNPPAAFLSAPPSRPGSGFKMAHLLQPLPPQPQSQPPPAAPSYSRYYESGSGSPEGVSILPDAPPPNGSASGAASLVPPAASIVHPQHQQRLPHKRAYRQRRKDPSCDACRERKVKCDASESASCTECSNRKVRCQFTKETNRRMSSIKQVQDLERQLLFTKQQLRQLRSRMGKPEYVTDSEPDSAAQAPPTLPDIGCRPPRPAKPPAAQDLSEVRSNLREYGRGILKAPTPYRQRGPRSLVTESPPLPPRNVADYLLSQYYSCIHSVLPVIHWPSFIADFEKIYHSGSLRGVTREWAAVLFGVFACGSIHTLDEDKEQAGKEYAKTSCGIIDVLQDSFSLDQARAALLVSIFLYEVNSKSASWVWIGSAVRVAQEIGLHIESGPGPALECEMKKRVWWGIYAWDRLLALEMGKPVLINDEDCDVDLPSSLGEQYVPEGAVPDDQQTGPLLATIHVVRSMGQLTKTLRCPTINPATLGTFERYFTACLATFPSQYHPKSDQYLDPRSLAPILYLQNARVILHRHNISPFSAREVRSSAMDYCTSASLDTAHLLSRCMRNPPDGRHDWRSLFSSSAGALLCTHVWRSVLLLLLRQEYTAALVCVQASAAIGDSRVVNVACGRYIAFFLKCLVARLQRNEVDFERDEEMMAYISGDMQGTSDGNWVWQGCETGSEMEAMSSNLSSPPTAQQDDRPPEETQLDWEGWEWMERTIQYLLSEEQRQRQSVYDTRFPGKLEPGDIKTELSESAEQRPNSYSRMTIASII